MSELTRYMQNQQKATKRLPAPWPVFEGTHKRAPSLASTLTEEELAALKTAYEQVVLPLDLGTDAAAWHDEVVDALACEFTRLTGKIVPGLILMAVAEEKRKRGLWFKVGRHGADRGEDFGDLDKIDERDE